jgi:hypothetical protein
MNLILYRMPDNLWVLALNGVALQQVTSAEQPDMALAGGLERALHITCQHRDCRIRPTANRINVVGLRLVSPIQS